MANRLNEVPTSLVPLGQFGDRNIPVRVTDSWYKFFQSLSTLVQNIINGVLVNTVGDNITSAGTTQGTAQLLENEWNFITIVPANSGVLMQNIGAGAPTMTYNLSGNNLKVYPPVGGQIDALGINMPYVLIGGKMQNFYQQSATQWRSQQLG